MVKIVFNGRMSKKEKLQDKLYDAIQKGNSDDVWGLIVLNKMDIEAPFKHQGGLTPLQVAAVYGHYDLVKFFVSEGAKIDRESDRGSLRATALRIAANNDHDRIVRFLLDHGASVDQSPGKGRDGGRYTDCGTALTGAAQADNVDIMRILLEYGANINAPNGDGITPLMFAAFFGREASVRFLLQRGADMDVKDNTGKTVKDILAGQENEKRFFHGSPTSKESLKSRDEILKILQEETEKRAHAKTQPSSKLPLRATLNLFR